MSICHKCWILWRDNYNFGLILQKCMLSHPHVGILPPPQKFKMNISNHILNLYWIAPDSLQVSTLPTIYKYVLSNNLTNSTKTFFNPTTCNPLTFCSYILDQTDQFFSYGVKNTTIFDYYGTVKFTFFAVNGAGNGNAATTFFLMLPKGTQAGNGCLKIYCFGTYLISLCRIQYKANHSSDTHGYSYKNSNGLHQSNTRNLKHYT